MGMFLVYNTAEDVLQHKQLTGDAVHVGVRKLEWITGSKPILDAFLNTPAEVTPEYNKYIYEGVPVYIHVFEEDSCIRSTNLVMYEHEYFMLPNPYKEFIEKYPVWKSQ